jgi:hypothetical protein
VPACPCARRLPPGGLENALPEQRQVSDQWLKTRKGRSLNRADLCHDQRVAVALQETIGLLKEIDQTIGRWPIE